MKYLVDFLTEKLHLTQDACSQELFSPGKHDFDKMNYYRTQARGGKGSNPKALVSSIKSNEKLGNRFAVAVSMGWTEAIKEFGDALVSRGCFTREEIDNYIATHKK